MLTLLSILTIVFIVFIHECGHLMAFQRYGIKVKEMAIGIPVRFITIRIKHPKIFQGVPIYVSPILLSGYVRPVDDKKTPELSPEKNLDISGAGIIMNLVFSCFAFALINAKTEYSIGFAILGIAILTWKKVICRYIFPIISALMIVFVPALIMQTVRMVPDLGHGSSVAIPELLNTITTWQRLVRFGGVVSLALALLNLLPLSILDGGHLVMVYIKKWFPDIVLTIYKVSTTLVILFVTLVCTLDGGLALIRIFWKFIGL